jgi:hypothetical protein
MLRDEEQFCEMIKNLLEYQAMDIIIDENMSYQMCIVIDVGNPWVFLLIPIPLPVKTRTRGHRSWVFQGYGFIGYGSVGMGKVHG